MLTAGTGTEQPSTGKPVPRFVDRRKGDDSRAQAIIESALDCIVTIDEAGRILEFNPAAEATFGHKRMDVLGRRMVDLIVPQRHRLAHNGGITSYLATGVGPALNTRLELPALRADGTEITVELITVPIQHGERMEFTGFLRDITELKRAREELARSESRYRLLVERAHRIITVLETDGTWRSSSGGRLLGHPDGFAPPDGLLALVHPDDRRRAIGFFAELVAGRRSTDESIDLRVMDGTGQYRVLETVGEDLNDEPAMHGVVLRSWDVTEARRQSAELANAHVRLQIMIASLPDAVLLEDDQGRVLVANEALTTLFALPPPDQIVGWAVTDPAHWSLAGWGDPDGFRASTLELVRSGGSVLGERLEAPGGRVLSRDCVPVHGPGGAFIGRLWKYRDVTRQVESEQQLYDRNQMLEEVAALKNQFVATVSHELRTPLTSIVSFAGLLADPEIGSLSQEQRGFVEVVERNSQRLLRLIADLLFLARLEARSMPLSLSFIDTAALVDEVAADLAPIARAAHVELVVDAEQGPPVEVDVDRMHQVLTNIVTNGLKFTQRSGKVRITSRPDGDGWSFVVSDTGLGVPAADLPHLFDAFFRASNSAGSTSGTGLGLATCRGLVELHGGRISATSTEGVGTVVTVWIPMRQPQPPPDDVDVDVSPARGGSAAP